MAPPSVSKEARIHSRAPGFCVGVGHQRAELADDLTKVGTEAGAPTVGGLQGHIVVAQEEPWPVAVVALSSQRTIARQLPPSAVDLIGTLFGGLHCLLETPLARRAGSVDR